MYANSVCFIFIENISGTIGKLNISFRFIVEPNGAYLHTGGYTQEVDEGEGDEIHSDAIYQFIPMTFFPNLGL